MIPAEHSLEVAPAEQAEEQLRQTDSGERLALGVMSLPAAGGSVMYGLEELRAGWEERAGGFDVGQLDVVADVLNELAPGEQVVAADFWAFRPGAVTLVVATRTRLIKFAYFAMKSSSKSWPLAQCVQFARERGASVADPDEGRFTVTIAGLGEVLEGCAHGALPSIGPLVAAAIAARHADPEHQLRIAQTNLDAGRASVRSARANVGASERAATAAWIAIPVAFVLGGHPWVGGVLMAGLLLSGALRTGGLTSQQRQIVRDLARGAPENNARADRAE